MTLNQLYSLSQDELDLLLYIVNVVDPPSSPKLTLTPRNLTWFRHDFLIQKIVGVFPKLLPEGYDTYVSMLNKLGYEFKIPDTTPQSTESKIEIKTETPDQSKTEVSGSA